MHRRVAKRNISVFALLPLLAVTAALSAAGPASGGKAGRPAAPVVPDTGWTVEPPQGFEKHFDEHHPKTLRWRRDVLLPSPAPLPGEGTQYEYLTVSTQRLPGGLVGSCSSQARARGLGEPEERTHQGLRMVTYICPGAEWSGSHGDSHSWRCLLDMDGKTGIEINFWSTWYRIKDPGRVDRDRTFGLEAFRAMCASLAPPSSAPAAAAPAKPGSGAPEGCEPGGFDAVVETVDASAGNLTYNRKGPNWNQWARAEFAPGVTVSADGAAAGTGDIRPGDRVRMERDCLTGLVTGIEIFGQVSAPSGGAAAAPGGGASSVAGAPAPAGGAAMSLPLPPGMVIPPRSGRVIRRTAPPQGNDTAAVINMVYKIYFRESVSDMTPNSKKKLEQAAEILAAYPDAKITVTGYDCAGASCQPARGREMADEVVGRLAGVHGIKKERMEITVETEAPPVPYVKVTIARP